MANLQPLINEHNSENNVMHPCVAFMHHIFWGKIRGFYEFLPNWSEWRDLNPRPLVPQTSALPGCATLRPIKGSELLSRSFWEKTQQSLFRLSFVSFEKQFCLLQSFTDIL